MLWQYQVRAEPLLPPAGPEQWQAAAVQPSRLPRRLPAYPAGCAPVLVPTPVDWQQALSLPGRSPRGVPAGQAALVLTPVPGPEQWGFQAAGVLPVRQRAVLPLSAGVTGAAPVWVQVFIRLRTRREPSVSSRRAETVQTRRGVTVSTRREES